MRIIERVHHRPVLSKDSFRLFGDFQRITGDFVAQIALAGLSMALSHFPRKKPVLI